MRKSNESKLLSLLLCLDMWSVSYFFPKQGRMGSIRPCCHFRSGSGMTSGLDKADDLIGSEVVCLGG